MEFAIIVSSKDPAGINIKEKLIENYNFSKLEKKFRDETVYMVNDSIKLYTTGIDSVHNENIDNEIDADFFLFATKHQSESGIPTLSVHSSGNWGKADYGGADKKLCVSPASYLKKALQLLEKNRIVGFDIIQECTHHGPYLEKAAMFIEIGSTEKEWVNEKAGEVIAKVITDLLAAEIKEYTTAVGIGGLHHTPNFKKIMLDSDIAVGHVCPKYNLHNLDKKMILQAMEKTSPKAGMIILDWKGLSHHKQKIVDILDELGIEWKKTKDF